MKAEQLRDLSESEMEDKLDEVDTELVKLNAQRATGTPPENPGKIKKLRKTVARIKTILNENS